MKEFEISLPIQDPITEEIGRLHAAKALGVVPSKVGHVTLLRRSIDARSKNILYRYKLRAYLIDEMPEEKDYTFVHKDVSSATPVIVAGAGPAGLFSALELIRLGFKPVIIERGKDVHARKYDIASISRQGAVNPDSNYCFGEGGAGTFSDGKLYTRSNKRGDIYGVLALFVQFGADKSIMIDAHPHIGSDRLPRIIEGMRHAIEECGGEYHFGSRITEMDYSSGTRQWRINTTSGYFEAPFVILATGHSATDLYRLFIEKGWPLEEKGFALGVRVEHPQSLINNARYHGRYQPYMPPAEYSLVEQIDGRGVFSFCMCPGGVLVPATTEPGTLVLNGMSNSRRNSRWANAGIVTSIEPCDIFEYFGGKYSSDRDRGCEMMLGFREEIERKAFAVTGSFKAPAQRMTDFIRSSGKRSVVTSLPATSYSPGTEAADLRDVLPEFVSERLRKAFSMFDRKIRGYLSSDALLLAVESRTSSPVRIPRDPETLEYVGCPALYPCGEGAGYAGGIVSSALDGINAARALAGNNIKMASKSASRL